MVLMPKVWLQVQPEMHLTLKGFKQPRLTHFLMQKVTLQLPVANVLMQKVIIHRHLETEHMQKDTQVVPAL
jgi:hypothetical protein